MTDIEQRLADAGLRVKPLEWERFNDRHYDAESYGKTYEIRPDTGRIKCACWCNPLGFLIKTGVNVNDAKKACDAHNAAAILSSLEVIE